MKKIFIGCLFLLLLSGCSKTLAIDEVIPELGKQVTSLENYCVEATYQTTKGSRTLNYKINIEKAQDKYKVVLKNNENNSVQVIVKNDQGVFVLTPSLNKSFKFESGWPNNTYHAYLIESVYQEILNDKTSAVNIAEDAYEITSTVLNPYNKLLSKQKVVVSKKNLAIQKVFVYDTSMNVIGTVVFTEFTQKEMKAEDFTVEKSMGEASLIMGEGKEVAQTITDPSILIEGVILKSKNELEDMMVYFYQGEREYTISVSKKESDKVISNTKIYTSLVELDATIGALSTYSLDFTYQGLEVSIISKNLSDSEKIDIANSFFN